MSQATMPMAAGPAPAPTTSFDVPDPAALPAGSPGLDRLRPPALIVAVLLGGFVLGQAANFIGKGRSLALEVQMAALIRGSLTALLAVGIVLVYRASRIINFAHASIGAVGAMLFYLLYQESRWPYLAAVAAGIVVSGVLGLLVELLFIRRFSSAPRLVLTVATIGISQIVLLVAGKLPDWVPWIDYEVAFRRIRTTPVTEHDLMFGQTPISGDKLLLAGLAVVLLLAMAAFFRFSNAGVAIRGAAENADRASLLGIDVGSLSSLVWVMVGLLSGTAAVLQIAAYGTSAAPAGVLSGGLLLPALAAAVIARMENLPLAVAGALALAVVDASVFAATNTGALTDAVILAVIIGGLLAQRGALSRAYDDAGGSFAAAEEVRPIPAELRSIPSVQNAVRRVRVLAALLVLAFPWLASPSQTTEGSLFAIYGIIAISLVILIGWGGQISLGQFAFVAVGGAVGGAISGRWGLPFPVALLGASLVGAAVAVAVGLPALRIKGLFLAVTTLSFAVVTTSVLLNQRYFGWLLPDQVTRPQFLFLDFDDARAFYYLTVAGVVVAVWAAKGLRSSRTGRVLIAMRDNERTAQGYGINLMRTRLATFALSGFLAAFAGVLYANLQHGVGAASYGPDRSLTMFLMAVIGGLGSVTGVLLGAVYVGLVTVLFDGPLAQLLAGGVGVLIVLLFFPRGLGGVAVAIRDAYLRRVAIRHRIHVPSLLGNATADDGLVPLSEKAEGEEDLSPEVLGRRYALPSAVATAGGSQVKTGWRF